MSERERRSKRERERMTEAQRMREAMSERETNGCVRGTEGEGEGGRESA